MVRRSLSERAGGVVTGYFVSTVGLDEKQITEYVRWQGDQDSGQAKLDLKSAAGSAHGYLLFAAHSGALPLASSLAFSD